jgi:hypothetical protein
MENVLFRKNDIYALFNKTASINNVQTGMDIFLSDKSVPKQPKKESVLLFIFVYTFTTAVYYLWLRSRNQARAPVSSVRGFWKVAVC